MKCFGNVLALAIGVLLSVGGTTSAEELFITVTGEATSAGTFTLSSSFAGNPPSLWVPLQNVSVSAGATSLDVRNQFLPAEGVRNTNTGIPVGAKRVRLAGIPAIKVESLSSTVTNLLNFWVQLDGGPFQFLEPGVPVTTNGITFSIIFANTPTMPSGAVPAIGAWGMAIMALILLGTGTVVFNAGGGARL